MQAVPRNEPRRNAECGSYDEEKQRADRERSEYEGRSMPPVLGGAAMAVLPVSPQTATQGNPHHHHNHHVHQGQTQVLLAAAGATTQAQPQLLYQPYNLMPAGNSPSPQTAFQHHPHQQQHQPQQQQQQHQLHHHHHHHHQPPSQQSNFLPADIANVATTLAL